MQSRVKVLGHPAHPMLIVFPLGLLATSVVFDVVGLIDEDGYWQHASYYLVGAGIVGGLAAGAVGTVDLMAIPSNTRAKRIGLFHAGSNLTALGIFAASWLIRNNAENRKDSTAIIFSVAGLAIATLGGWLGGELVFRLRVGVDENAHLDAPSSLVESTSTMKQVTPSR